MADMIDLATVQILNSPDVHAWPATTAITKLALGPTGVHVEFTKDTMPGGWPDIPFGDPADHGSLLFTLWIVLNVGGQWLAAGCIEFWRGLYESGGPVDGYAKNWYYDPNRWPGMAGHQPAVGERVGFFITSGDARHGDDGVGMHERSSIVAIDFPPASGGVFTFDAAQPPAPPVPVPLPPDPPAPIPEPPAPPAPVPPITSDEALERLFELFIQLAGSVSKLTEGVLAIDDRLQRIEDGGLRIRL